jgi:Bacterial regulatory protein, arsR family
MEAREAVHIISTRAAVEALREQGRSATSIAAELGIGKSTVCYHLRRLGVPPDDRCNRRYDWDAVQRFYDEGHGVTACLDHFGMTRASFVPAVRRGAVRTRPQRKPIEEMFRPGVNRNHLRLRLLADGLKEARCEQCGLTAGAAAASSHQRRRPGQPARESPDPVSQLPQPDRQLGRSQPTGIALTPRPSARRGPRRGRPTRTAPGSGPRAGGRGRRARSAAAPRVGGRFDI